VEIVRYRQAVLVARQNDGNLDPFPIWNDIQTFDGRPWRGLVDVISGGFPCQDISPMGKLEGIEGERSGLWKEMARVIGEVRPRFVFSENSPMLARRGLNHVLHDLAALGYDATWAMLGAGAIGAPHQRDRLWVLARNKSLAGETAQDDALADPDESAGWKERPKIGAQGRGEIRRHRTVKPFQRAVVEGRASWAREPNVGRVADGIPDALDRLEALGDAQVPLCAAVAFKLLSRRIHST
jgi:DNA (cytosine-5)-methyltransferase 1